MAPANALKFEREKKLKVILAFASKLPDHLTTTSTGDPSLLEDLNSHIRNLPLPPSSAVTAKQEDLDTRGTELWNLSTRLLRNEIPTKDKSKTDVVDKNRLYGMLRVFAFLLLDMAGAQAVKGKEAKGVLRLMRIALKTARFCVVWGGVEFAVKVMERAGVYQEVIGGEEGGAKEPLLVEYFAVRILLAWKQDRLDTAEHMYAKSQQLQCSVDAVMTESHADLYYEIGKDKQRTQSFEIAIRWLERAHDTLSEKDLEELGPEAGELRLSIMQSIAQAYMKLSGKDAEEKAWDMVRILETEHGDKMSVQLLRIEMLSATNSNDSSQYSAVLHRMIRTVVMNDTNFKTILHHIHNLKNLSPVTSCKLIDELLELRLFREEDQKWIERAFITRIWIATTTPEDEDTLESMQDLFEKVHRNIAAPLSGPAIHAAQTLLWKRVEAAFSNDQFQAAESWCKICLHALFDKAGELNKSKIRRKLAICAMSRQDYSAAQAAFSAMSDIGRGEPTTRYLMYKVAVHSGNDELDHICRQSSKDASLLYACVLEAQSIGDRKQELVALRKVLEKYDHGAPSGVHLPALLRCTIRSLVAELIKDGSLREDVLEELCKTFEGASRNAQASRSRPSTSAQQLFTESEFEWFSKNAYNISLKYCIQMDPKNLVRLLVACIQFITLLQAQDHADDNDLSFRLIICNFLAACAFTTLARAEDNIHDCLQYYLQARKYCQDFRKIASEELTSERIDQPGRNDIIAKHFQLVKLELEAVLKLESWDALDELFAECWKYKDPQQLESLADLVLVIHSCIAKSNVDSKYQQKLLSVLQKIINLTWKQTNHDIVKLSRWIRCLFQLALTLYESFSLACLEHAAQFAAARKGVSAEPDIISFNISQPTTPPPSSPVKIADEGEKDANHYPTTELEWLATTGFNRAVDYYLQENDEMMHIWADKAMALAQWAEDGGALSKLLREKYLELKWGE